MNGWPSELTSPPAFYTRPELLQGIELKFGKVAVLGVTPKFFTSEAIKVELLMPRIEDLSGSWASQGFSILADPDLLASRSSITDFHLLARALPGALGGRKALPSRAFFNGNGSPATHDLGSGMLPF